MTERLFHRGPDSEGSFTQDNVCLSMRRLSIIDLAGGMQPLYNEDRSIVLVCNGEIYNHRELRADLESRGHQFKTHSDCETIIHAYEEYGTAFLTHLQGMFAFALWNTKTRSLLLARDRMGEKPLFLFRSTAGETWFSSELRSLLPALERPPKITVEAFNLFMTFQYVPEPLTPIEGIEVLPAGHYLELSPNKTEVRPCKYWDLDQAKASTDNPVGSTREALERACGLMSTADVPVAIALSGGIDSSLVAALTARHYPGKLHAFTIGYSGRPATDERSYAASLARDLGIGFTEVELSTAEVLDYFPALIEAMDAPIGDIAAYGYYAVSRAARQAGYPVLLSGTGGDEFFWGYEWVREAVHQNELWRTEQTRAQPWWKRLLGSHGAKDPGFFAVHADLQNGDRWSRSLLPLAARNQLPENYWLSQTQLDPEQPVFRAVTELLNRTWLRSNCLALVDRMSMAHSVEVRLPLLETGLVDHVTGMRNSGLVDWRKPHKWLLVEALKEILPAEVLSRKKQGFTPPVQEWMSGIVKRFRHLIPNGTLVQQGLLDPDQARGDFTGFDLPSMYKLVLFECWANTHLKVAKGK